MLSIPCHDVTLPRLDLFQDEVTRDEKRLRPWKSVWPPDGHEALSPWQQSEFPEVSSWKFDSEYPFDRPWRTWTRTSQAKSEATRNPPKEEDADVVSITAIDDVRDCLEIGCEDFSVSDLARQIASAAKLDSEIKRRDMRSIVPDTFYYLSPSTRYLSEKPYLSRLPSLPAFVRTNIVGTSKSVPVHEISGNEHLFTLDKSGFEFVKHLEEFKDWSDSSVRETYLPKIANWLKHHLDCSKVYIYAYNVSTGAFKTICMAETFKSSVAIRLKWQTREHGRHRSSERIVVCLFQLRLDRLTALSVI